MQSRQIALAAAVSLAAMAVAGPAASQALNDRFWLEASAYWPEIDTVVTVSRPDRPGTTIDMEEDLNLDDRDTLPAFYAGARFFDRFMVAGEYYALDREASETIGREIVFDDATFPVNASVESSVESDVYRLVLGYSFIKNDRAELGGSLGLHATQFDVAVRGEAQVGEAEFQTESRRREFLAPLPTVGAYAGYQVTPKVVINGRVDWMSLGMDEFSGSILNAQASVGYRIWGPVEIGAAYRFVDYGLEVDKPEYTLDADYDFSGPALFLRIGWQ